VKPSEDLPDTRLRGLVCSSSSAGGQVGARDIHQHRSMLGLWNCQTVDNRRLRESDSGRRGDQDQDRRDEPER
jgi:hypothetical protein